MCKTYRKNLRYHFDGGEAKMSVKLPFLTGALELGYLPADILDNFHVTSRVIDILCLTP